MPIQYCILILILVLNVFQTKQKKGTNGKSSSCQFSCAPCEKSDEAPHQEQSPSEIYPRVSGHVGTANKKKVYESVNNSITVLNFCVCNLMRNLI